MINVSSVGKEEGGEGSGQNYQHGQRYIPCTQAFPGYQALTMSQVLGEPRDTECVLDCGRNLEDGMEGAKLEAGGPVNENTGRVQTRVDEP